ncbi:MAG: AAA family ATPase [Acidihalobacter sp.]|jgi:predicted kinase
MNPPNGGAPAADDGGPAAPVLYSFSGLPGTGKTTLAKALANRFGAVYLRIDTVEQALRDICAVELRADEGYRLAYRLAAENLRLGIDVVADSCNPIATTRRAWESVAEEAGADCINIETSCPDTREHRRRILGRRSDIEGLKLPTWQDVSGREYQPWAKPVIHIDTAGRSPQECFNQLLRALNAAP